MIISMLVIGIVTVFGVVIMAVIEMIKRAKSQLHLICSLCKV